jgi:hypothetical protein
MKVLKCLLALTLISSCNSTKSFDATLYLTNNSPSPYDSVKFEVKLNNEVLVEDSVYNQYVSHQWQDYTAKIPTTNSKLSVKISGKSFAISKDTIVEISAGTQIFCAFYYIPYKYIYDDPIIYKYITGPDVDLKELVDSLMTQNLIAPIYRRDSIPATENIIISLK